jgi:uncharacterized protein YjiS (DUF1127 family)
MIMSVEFIDAAKPATVAPSFRSRPNLIARAAAWMRAYRHHRREIRQLQAMDGHLLADLGITRAQVEYLAQQPFAGDWGAASLQRRR